MSSRQNPGVETRGTEALPRRDHLPSFNLIVFATDDMKGNGAVRRMENAGQVQAVRIPFVLIDKIRGPAESGDAVAAGDGVIEFVDLSLRHAIILRPK